ncbi:unnamed protein product, partial [Mesorhabditis belari]|uniref:Uncharacterized protein n=1 Tax=Mesorhabditis belari TaxID=2138241 RepID=A0AAF3F391_9BILA
MKSLAKGLNLKCNYIDPTKHMPKGKLNFGKYMNSFYFAQYRLCHYKDATFNYDLTIGMTMILLSQTTIWVNLLAIRAIRRNPNVASLQRYLLLVDCTLRATRGLAELYFASCTAEFGYDNKPHCLSSIGYPWSGVMLNQIISTLYISIGYSVQWLETAISVNRVTAGQCHGNVQGDLWAMSWQYDLVTVHFYILLGVCLVSLIVEPITWMRQREAGTDGVDKRKLKAEEGFSIQMICINLMNMVVSLVSVIAMSIFNNVIENGPATDGSQAIYTCALIVCGCLQSLIIIYFNWRIVEKRDEHSTFSKAFSESKKE